jgi:hypothetical protein
MGLQDLLQRVLFLFGIGFFIANVLIFVDLVRFRIRKRSALLVWQGEKPQFYGFSLALGVMLGLLFVFKLFVQHRPLNTLLGESMMFVYYGYALPLSTRIARGFYKDGIWSDTGGLLEGRGVGDVDPHFPLPEHRETARSARNPLWPGPPAPPGPGEGPRHPHRGGGARSGEPG